MSAAKQQTPKRASGHRHPPELRERAVRMVEETIKKTGKRDGVMTRVAVQLGLGSETVRHWVKQVAPSTYYAAVSRPPSARRLEDEQLKMEITRTYQDNFDVYPVEKGLEASQARGYRSRSRPGGSTDGRTRTGGSGPRQDLANHSSGRAGATTCGSSRAELHR